MAAAASAFMELGYEETRISDIVSRAQVAQGTFYLHFASKAEVYLAITGEVTSEIFARIRRAVEPTETLREAIDAGIEAGFEAMVENRTLLSFISRSPLLPEVRKQTAEFGTPALKLAAERIERAMESGELSQPIDPIISARLLHGGIDAVVNFYIDSPDATRDKVQLETKSFAYRALGLHA